MNHNAIRVPTNRAARGRVHCPRPASRARKSGFNPSFSGALARARIPEEAYASEGARSRRFSRHRRRRAIVAKCSHPRTMRRGSRADHGLLRLSRPAGTTASRRGSRPRSPPGTGARCPASPRAVEGCAVGASTGAGTRRPRRAAELDKSSPSHDRRGQRAPPGVVIATEWPAQQRDRASVGGRAVQPSTSRKAAREGSDAARRCCPEMRPQGAERGGYAREQTE